MMRTFLSSFSYSCYHTSTYDSYFVLLAWSLESWNITSLANEVELLYFTNKQNLCDYFGSLSAYVAHILAMNFDLEP